MFAHGATLRQILHIFVYLVIEVKHDSKKNYCLLDTDFLPDTGAMCYMSHISTQQSQDMVTVLSGCVDEGGSERNRMPPIVLCLGEIH